MDDYSDGLNDATAPRGTLAIGGSTTGSVEVAGDRDIFSVSLVAGQTYTFDLTRGATAGLADPTLRLTNASGTQLAFNDDFGFSNNSRITYTATTTGTFFLEAAGYGSGTGGYVLTGRGPTTTTPPAPTDDYKDSLTDNTAPFGSLTVGQPVSGRIETGGDRDVFAVTLTAGQSYTFGLASASSGGLADPSMRLLNGNGTQLAANNDSNGGRDSSISFTATTSGTYYVEARGAAPADTGAYTLTATRPTPPAPTDDFRDSVSDTTAPLGTVAVGGSRAGRIEVAGDTDLFGITLTAGQTYTFDLARGATGGLANPELRVLDAAGNQLATNDDAGGSLNSRITFTAANSGTFYLEAADSAGTNTGSYTVSAAAVPVAPPPSGDFDIRFNFSGDQRYLAAFEEAAAIWEEAITGDIPDYVSSRFGAIDDLLIDASAIVIDGAGGTLGRAGPDELRPGSRLPGHGIMEFDSADLARMEQNGTLVGVVTHEMGHVLGLGTLWDQFGLKSNNTSYTGQNALDEYRVLTGTNAAFIPLEATGGPGTAGGHWAENVFGTEIMTGFANGGMELSRVTIGSLEDLGYAVNYAAADPYVLPSTRPALMAQEELLIL